MKIGGAMKLVAVQYMQKITWVVSYGWQSFPTAFKSDQSKKLVNNLFALSNLEPDTTRPRKPLISLVEEESQHHRKGMFWSQSL
jgi:hypothetical protein